MAWWHPTDSVVYSVRSVCFATLAGHVSVAAYAPTGRIPLKICQHVSTLPSGSDVGSFR